MPRRNPKSEIINQKSAGPPGRPVWRFIAYKERFWADTRREDIHVQQYIRWYINAWHGPGGEVIASLNRLRRYGNFIELQGSLVELLTIATNTSPEYQGYLLSSRKEPMEASDVGSVLRVNGRKALVVLTRLESVGFLEKVAWLPQGSDGPIPDDHIPHLLQDVASAGKRAAGKGGGEPRFRSENEGEPLQKPSKVEDKAAQAMVEGTAAAETPPEGGQSGEAVEPVKLVCPNCGHQGQSPKGRAKSWQCTQCGTLVPNPQISTSRTSTSPDAGAGLGGPRRAATSPNARPPSIVRLQDVREIEPHKYSAAGNDFGQQVCAAWGFVSHDGGEYANEVAHWAKLYDDELVTLSEIGQRKARDKLLRIAAEVRTGKKRPDAPGGYLERVLQNAIRDQKRAGKVKAG